MGKKHRVFCLVVLAVGLLLVSGCPFKSGVEGEKWFRYAMKFDEARTELVENDRAKKDTWIKDLNRIGKLELKYLRVEQPTEDEILAVLRSEDRKLQRVGLVAMCLKPIETEQVVGILFEFLEDENRWFKCYAYSSLGNFKSFPQSIKEESGKRLLEIIKQEKGKGLCAAQFFYVLAKFPCEEVRVFFTEQLMSASSDKENRLFRICAFNGLKDMGDSYVEQAREYINAHGSSEVKEAFLKNAKGWTLVHSEDE